MLYQPFCSGALIGEATVATAEHCVRDLDYYMSWSTVGFAVGPDAFNPTAVYPIVDWDWEVQVPSDYSTLFGQYGSDVGVVYLGQRVTDTTPLAL